MFLQIIIYKLTIPSRSAPPPPGGRNSSRRIAAQVRYEPTSNWDDGSFSSSLSPASSSSQSLNTHRKIPPPRPPPPKINLKSSVAGRVAPQSASLFTNLFAKKPPPRPPPAKVYLSPSPSCNETALIDFHSPPSSPTLTARSNSDGMSVDSFSSDGTPSTHNVNDNSSGNNSQAESGFEDDFDLYSTRSVKTATDLWHADPFSPPVNQTAVQPVPKNLGSVSFYANSRNQHEFTELCNGKNTIRPEPKRTMPTIIIPRTELTGNIKLSPAITRKITTQSSRSIFTNQSTSVSEYRITDFEDGDYSPPMPTIPPPAPPAKYLQEIDDITEHTEPFGIALYDYPGTHDDDLPFKKNDRITLLRQVDSEWLFGKLRSGCEGLFPANYINVKVPLKGPVIPVKPTLSAGSAYKPVSVKALYTFNPETTDDLGLLEGEEVTVLWRINDDWLFGGNKINKQGQFPANFIAYIPSGLPTRSN